MSGEVVQAAPPPFSIHYTLFPVVKSSPRAADGRGNPAAPAGTERSAGRGWSGPGAGTGDTGSRGQRLLPPHPSSFSSSSPSPPHLPGSPLPAPRTAQIRSQEHSERPQPEFRVTERGHVELSPGLGGGVGHPSRTRAQPPGQRGGTRGAAHARFPPREISPRGSLRGHAGFPAGPLTIPPPKRPSPLPLFLFSLLASSLFHPQMSLFYLALLLSLQSDRNAGWARGL